MRIHSSEGDYTVPTVFRDQSYGFHFHQAKFVRERMTPVEIRKERCSDRKSETSDGETRCPVARPPPRSTAPSMVATVAASPGWDINAGRRFVGDEEQSRRCVLTLKYPIEQGTVTIWNYLEDASGRTTDPHTMPIHERHVLHHAVLFDEELH